MLTEGARAISFTVLLWEGFQIEAVSGAHQTLHPFKDGVLGSSGGAFGFVLVLFGKKTPERFVLFMILGGGVGKLLDIGYLELAAYANRTVFCTDLAAPIAVFEGLKLISFRAEVQENKVRNQAVELLTED
ncbi:MAG: hypothetical protein M2R45_02420 [Verrucomicrobia subdivision 3 bacterium]|nr:hypothetical protein [Limisphaerales bacterium]MCS1416374.1 hypothetical protein [Limisphaerales bacterium]